MLTAAPPLELQPVLKASHSRGKSPPIEVKAQLQPEGAHRPHGADVPGAPAQVTGDVHHWALQDTYYLHKGPLPRWEDANKWQ